MKFTSDQLNKLPIGKVLHYTEFTVSTEKRTWDDIVQIVSHTEYSGPVFKVLFSTISGIGEESTADTFEIANGRARAIDDTDFIIKFIFDKDMS